MIEVREAHKSLGEFSLRGVDLAVESGEYMVVLGPTGAGKTVLLECIAGIHPLDRGRVLLDGRDVTRLPPEQRNVAYVPQDYVLFNHMSLRRNIAFSLTVRHVPRADRDQRVQALAEMLRISHLLERRPRTLSGGEQQRGAIARALAVGPTVLLLDEPLSALDEGTRGEMAAELARISRELGTTVIHVCHNFDEALDLADRIAILRDGAILQVGTPHEVLRRPASEFLARFVGCVNLFTVRSLDRAALAVDIAPGVRLTAASLPDAAGADERFIATIRPEDILVVPRADASVPAGGNALALRVARIDDRGRVCRVRLEGPVVLDAMLTRQALAATCVGEGGDAWAVFDAEDVHVLVP